MDAHNLYSITMISVPEIKDAMGHEVLGVHVADRRLYPFQCRIGLLNNLAVYISELGVHSHVISLAASCHFISMNVNYADLYAIYLPV